MKSEGTLRNSVLYLPAGVPSIQTVLICVPIVRADLHTLLRMQFAALLAVASIVWTAAATVSSFDELRDASVDGADISIASSSVISFDDHITVSSDMSLTWRSVASPGTPAILDGGGSPWEKF